jgi:hypothetical protein
MSLARVLGCAALAGLLLACSGKKKPQPAQTAVPTAQPTERISPTATPLPASILNDGCPVTEPNGSTPPGEDPDRTSNVLGNGAIWVGLYPEGTVIFEPDGPGGRDPLTGAYAMKFWWWRGVEGQLEITGQRLDGEAPPMWGGVPEGYGDTGFQATGLVFPTEGCWEVTGRVGDASITFVTRVVSFYPPFKRYEVGEVTLATCPVTEPNGIGALDDEPRFAYSSAGISTKLWPAGRVVVSPRGAGEQLEDGSLAVEWPWLRGPPGELEITGRRLDEPAPPLRAEVPDGYGEIGAQPSELVFPTPGCWEVTARVGSAVLLFVTLVESRY